MDGAEFLPVFAKACQRISFTHASHFILICYYIYFQTRKLLLITRIVKIRIENAVWRYKDLRGRSEFTGTCCKSIHSLDCIISQDRPQTILNRKIPAIECRMIPIESCQFLHHLQLTAFDLWITQIVVLILGPAGTHEYLHAMFRRRIHDGIHRALAPLGIMPVHQLRRIIGLPLIRNRHEDKIFHSHLLHLGNLCCPHLRIGIIYMRWIRILVTYVLIWQIDECSCYRQDAFRLYLNIT